MKKADGPPLTTWQLLRHPGVAQVVLIFNYVMLQAYTYTAVSPVYSYLPVELGGLGFPPEGIAGIAALGGAAQSIWLLVVFSRLHNRVGTYRLLMYCAIAWPIFFAAAPMFNELLRHHLTPVFWATAPITLVMGSGVAMAFSKSAIPNF